MADFLWWRDGVVYQIYPRSFKDTSGNGLGDLPGIISKLDYLADLGIDAIWLSPIYPSPDVDFSYDISNHTDVDPRFGTLADFDKLVAKAHSLGIRVILDMVLNHTSDQHAWFQESRSSKENPKRDWYIWRDKPNNWQASFGGKAWTFDQTSGQYYLHSFTSQQPDVNWRNPQVRAAQLGVVDFWLKRGADGVRLDVFNACFKDANFQDNPKKFGLRAFDRQQHIHDMDQPEMIPLLQELRVLLDSYKERYAVGETYLPTSEKVLLYCGADRLHAAFSFDFTAPADFALSYPWNPEFIKDKVTQRQSLFARKSIWPTTVLSNHDLPRAASRYCKGEDDRQAKVGMALLLTLPGTPYMYQGEEIGMRNIKLKRREILDPPGKLYWPLYKGRDGARSPMQWDASPYAGFSVRKPWLPVHPNYSFRNVDAQKSEKDSLFNFTRSLLALRKIHPALRGGDLTFLNAPKGILAFTRHREEETLLVLLNFGGGSLASAFTLFGAQPSHLLFPTEFENSPVVIFKRDVASGL